MSRYSHTIMEQRSEAMAMLPEIVAAVTEQIAEGTTGKIYTAESPAFSGEKSRITANTGEQAAVENMKSNNAANGMTRSGLTKSSKDLKEVRGRGFEPRTNGLKSQCANPVTVFRNMPLQEQEKQHGGMHGVSAPDSHAGEQPQALPADLQTVIDAWPTLPDAIKAGWIETAKAFLWR